MEKVDLLTALARSLLERRGFRQQNAGAEVIKAIADKLAKKMLIQTINELK
ncbi:MAG: hypothetical protein AOA65_0532 [Candidatus Bathyarchaeota archaeon BA1]|nr:MAG: hypothetical protein AOA65_0532 [Candidatus Bathyarchaeota archaeon BA1]